MTIYDLLRLLVKGVARQGAMTAIEVEAAIDLIRKLEAVDAFGTVAGMTGGQKTGEIRKGKS